MADEGSLTVSNDTPGTVDYHTYGIVPNSDPIKIDNACGTLQPHGSRTIPGGTLAGYANYKVEFVALAGCTGDFKDSDISGGATASLTFKGSGT